MKAKANVSYFRDPELPGIDLCLVQNSHHRFPDHFHEKIYGVGLMQSGASFCFRGDAPDPVVGPGEVTLLNPGQIHSGVPVDEGPVTYFMCYITLEAMKNLAGESDSGPAAWPEFTTGIVHEKQVSALFRQVFRTLMHSRDCLEKEALLVAAFHFLFSCHGRAGQSQYKKLLRHPVSRAREILSAELDRKLTLEEVAQSVDLSRYHFLRIFKQDTGLSPHLYRIQKRIEAGRELLLKGTPAAQAALETGFSDQSHFANTFRRYFGATPRQYLSLAAS
ncbi:helix-turn-helix domain-containing protein [Desulfospira joergensenii]|uniref:helix-turn-helix domain-containing protein n=1 Tax=Desulfospira joergensenii TaxID=53329 RepID=UPI0003B4E8A7|nr:AraC family transcriptional regulator [Desulfospira joergensenii]